MKLHFPITEIRKGIEEIKTAKTAKELYGVKTGHGFWLVGDQGVYLMPNTTDGKHNTSSEKPLVIYANECNPDKLEFDTWWENKRASFGGDDGVEFIGIKDIETTIANENAQHLVIELTPESFSIGSV